MRKNKLIKIINPKLLYGIAHRGLHNDIFIENGLKAFENAMNNDLPIELDVHLTKDLKLIVCHDDDLKRTTGKSGIIEELTLLEIKTNYKLLDGEEIPTLDEVLDLINERVPIVIELKVRDNGWKLGKITRSFLDTHVKDTSNFMIISFDPRALWGFGRSKYINSLLLCEEHAWTYIFRHCFDSLDIDKTMLSKKKIQKYSKNHFINVWTIESVNDFDKVYQYIDTATFQNMDYKYIVKRLKEKHHL